MYLVMEFYDNGEFYEDNYQESSPIHAFNTKAEAENFIKEMDTPLYDKETKFKEVKEGDPEYMHVAITGKQYIRTFIYEAYYKTYITQAYFLKEIPFG